MDASTELFRTRLFAAGPFCFTVATSTAEDRDLVERLFADLPQSDRTDPPDGCFVLTRDRTGGDIAWSLSGPRLEGQPKLSEVSALTRLMSAVNLCALDFDPGSLHLHAAAAARSGQAVIIAARRNTGKTTTVAHLVMQGWDFITDEMVALHPDKDEITGFPKPLSIKPDGGSRVRDLTQWMLPGGASDGDAFRYVPIGATGASVAAFAHPRLVVLLRRPDGDVAAAASSRPLAPTDAVVALMQETLDATRYGASALRLARLAGSASCVEVTIGSPQDTARLIEHLFDEEPPERSEVSALEVSPAMAPGVVSVAIGDRIVVHDEGTGRIFALDDVASRVWRQLGGWNNSGLDLDGPVIGAFVEGLRSMGVLAQPSNGARSVGRADAS